MLLKKRSSWKRLTNLYSLPSTTCSGGYPKAHKQILFTSPILYPDYNLFCGSPNAFSIANCLSTIQPAVWSYEQKIITKFLQVSIRTTTCLGGSENLVTKSFQFSSQSIRMQTTTCLGGMEKPCHQILPILYPDYHMFGGYGKPSSNPSNSLSRIRPAFGAMNKKSSPNSYKSLSRLPRVWGHGKSHHQILRILYPDYHVFGGYGKTLINQIL